MIVVLCDVVTSFLRSSPRDHLYSSLHDFISSAHHDAIDFIRTNKNASIPSLLAVSEKEFILDCIYIFFYNVMPSLALPRIPLAQIKQQKQK